MYNNFVFGHACFCGRSFAHLGAYRKHQKTCKKSKKTLSRAVEAAKENIAQKPMATIPRPSLKLDDIDSDQNDAVLSDEPQQRKRIDVSSLHSHPLVGLIVS
jgi:hypothetical protein